MLLPPIVDGVRGIEPDKLLGGLNPDIGVGGADRSGDPSILDSSK